MKGPVRVNAAYSAAPLAASRPGPNSDGLPRVGDKITTSLDARALAEQ